MTVPTTPRKTNNDQLLADQPGHHNPGRPCQPPLPRFVQLLLRIFRIDVFAKQEKTFDRMRSTSEDVVRIGGRRHNARWFREFLDFDPRPLLARIDAPVFALTGGKDLQTPADDVAAIGDLVAGPFEGHVVDDVSHILRHEPGRPNLKRYKRQVDEPLDGRVVELLTKWSRSITESRSATRWQP